MDHRIALMPNTPLRLCNDKGEAIHCTIESEIGRGSSCIVYEASRVTETGDRTLYRVKEFYPYKLNIFREENDWLTPAVNNTEIFNQEQEQLRSDFSRTNELFYSSANYTLMTNQLDIFRQNGTTYILSAYSSRKTLATYKPESLKECIILVKQVSYVLGNIHKHGYLYLDVKPDNVLVVDGLQKQIQLFDFDSLLPFTDIKQFAKQDCCNERLSYTKGFAPIELQAARIKRLGPHTDVFGIGALLFYLLFGYTPAAPDCETDAEYNFSKIQYDYNKCDDKLFGTLNEFFHNSLAVYYADRYQSMQDVFEQLQKIEKFADPAMPRIFSTKIIKPKYLFGRDREFVEMDRLLADTDYNCLFVSGMSGIGKSTFVKRYLLSRWEKFDTVLYMTFKGNIEDTISDDGNIEINTLRQDEQTRCNVRYFNKKLQKIRELVRGKASIIVIDNFTGQIDADLRALLETELKVVLLTRQSPPYRSCHELKLSAISDQNALRYIFEANLGRPILEDELNGFERIVQQVDRHTLVLELIAKQIANNRQITISGAAALTKKCGFSSIALEKVTYEKDNKSGTDTIGNIIDALFEANALSEKKKALMKVASLLGDAGIDINQFHQILKLSSKDDANELIKDGWLMITGNVISMHRVIQEAIHRLEWSEVFVHAAEQFLTYFYIEISLESTKNNYPKKLHGYTRLCQKKKFEKQGLAGKVAQERCARANSESPADIKKLTRLLMQAEDILKQCKREPTIAANDIYTNLLYITVLNMPEYNEEYILAETQKIFINSEDDFVLNGTAELLNGCETRNPVTIMQLYAMVFRIHVANGRIWDAEKTLERAEIEAKKVHHPMAYALYYTILSEYYDTLLNGSYDTEKPNEQLILDKMLDAIKHTLRYAKKTILCDVNHLYVKGILGKAAVLMRNSQCSAKNVRVLIESAQKIITENTSQYADVRLDYYMVCGWYFALICNNEETADKFFQESEKLSEIIIPTDIEKIDRVLIPCANAYFELRDYKKAIYLLYKGTRLCFSHSNADLYAHKKQELCEHLWQVGMEATAFELCQKIIELVDYENEEVIDPQNKVIIPENIRNIIKNKSTQ